MKTKPEELVWRGDPAFNELDHCCRQLYLWRDEPMSRTDFVIGISYLANLLDRGPHFGHLEILVRELGFHREGGYLEDNDPHKPPHLKQSLGNGKYGKLGRFKKTADADKPKSNAVNRSVMIQSSWIWTIYQANGMQTMITGDCILRCGCTVDQLVLLAELSEDVEISWDVVADAFLSRGCPSGCRLMLLPVRQGNIQSRFWTVLMRLRVRSHGCLGRPESPSPSVDGDSLCLTVRMSTQFTALGSV